MCVPFASSRLWPPTAVSRFLKTKYAIVNSFHPFPIYLVLHHTQCDRMRSQSYDSFFNLLFCFFFTCSSRSFFSWNCVANLLCSCLQRCNQCHPKQFHQYHRYCCCSCYWYYVIFFYWSIQCQFMATVVVGILIINLPWSFAPRWLSSVDANHTDRVIINLL